MNLSDSGVPPSDHQRVHGINPKMWFYGFRDEIRAKADHARAVLAGSASERWLSGELFGFLAKNVGDRLTLFPEDSTRDLTLYSVRNERADWASGPVAAIEVKLVYRTYSDERVRRYARRLIQQVCTNATNCGPTYGYMFGVFVLWDGYKPKVRGTLQEFRRAIGALLRSECSAAPAGFNVLTGKEAMETILEEKIVQVGGAAAAVGVVGQYLIAEGA